MRFLGIHLTSLLLLTHGTHGVSATSLWPVTSSTKESVNGLSGQTERLVVDLGCDGSVDNNRRVFCRTTELAELGNKRRVFCKQKKERGFVI